MVVRGQIRRFLAASLFLALEICPVAAGGENINLKRKPGPASASLDDYLQRVRAAGAEQPSTTGSLWISSGPLSSPSADYKAYFAGDLIIVQLVDSFSAATSGENQVGRQFSTQSAVTGLVGKVSASNSLQNLFNANSKTALDGKGQSTMSSNLQLTLAGRVVEVMPNGVMVIEAARDFTVGNDRQTVILRGLVRPGDVTPANTVLSSAVTNLELEIKGKGAVADATSRPNPVVRLLLKVLSF